MRVYEACQASRLKASPVHGPERAEPWESARERSRPRPRGRRSAAYLARSPIWRPTHLMSVLQGPTAQISQLNTLLSPYRLLPGPFSWLGLPLSPLFTVLTRDVRDGTVARHTSDTTRAHDTRTWTWTWTWFASSRPVRPTKDGPTVIWPPAGRGDDPDPIRHIAHRARRRWQGEGQRGRGRRVRRRQRVRRQQHSLEKLL